MNIKIQLERTKAEMNKTIERHRNDQYISHQRTLLDKGLRKDHSDFGKTMERTQIDMLNQVLSDHRAIYDQKIAQERALANSALQKAREENDDNTNNKWQLFDSMNNQLRAQLEELENECSKLKTIVESLIQREEVRGNMNDEVEDVDQLVHAHANERTKICHLYIVGGPGFYDEEGRPWQPDEEYYRPLESDEEAEQDDASPPMKKRVLQSDEEAKEDDTSPAMKKRVVE